MYPAMTMEEACEKLNTIPVFAVTDDSGNGVIVRDEEVRWHAPLVELGLGLGTI